MVLRQENSTITVGLVQMSISEDTTANTQKAMTKIREAAKKGAEIVCLPELYRTAYFPRHKGKDVCQLAEAIQNESVLSLSSLAKELRIVIIAPIFERDRNGKHYNSAVVIDADGGIVGTYRKVHIPYDRFFYEKDYFETGNLGYRVFRTRYACLGILICYDQWFPEAARINTLKGADVIFYPTAIGYIEGDPLSEKDWYEAWEIIQRSHAIANGIHIATVNRVGKEGEIEFWGSSFVCDSFGRVLGKASKKDEEVLVVDVDLSQNKRIRDGWGFIKNRRPETYSQLLSRNTPRELGYTMPAEWERHDAVWIAWPHDPITFPDRVEEVEETYLEIIGALHQSEDINLFVTNVDMQKKVTELLGKGCIDSKRIKFHIWDYADVWFRDYGPIFLHNRSKQQLSMVGWIFDAWGKKYPELMKDTLIPRVINQKMQLTYFNPGIVLEGGSIDVNGEGTLLTTEQCLLNRNRNPQLSRTEIEQYLMDYLGVSHIIWLKEGIVGDDTDGHIDDIARFVNPTTILCAYEENEEDPNHSILREDYEILLEARDQHGNELSIIKMPMPPKIVRYVRGENKRLPASYLNFYIGNKVVLVPIFGHENDGRALNIMEKVFPNRRVIGINCLDLLYGLGTVHCATQQQPAANREPSN